MEKTKFILTYLLIGMYAIEKLDSIYVMLTKAYKKTCGEFDDQGHETQSEQFNEWAKRMLKKDNYKALTIKETMACHKGFLSAEYSINEEDKNEILQYSTNEVYEREYVINDSFFKKYNSLFEESKETEEVLVEKTLEKKIQNKEEKATEENNETPSEKEKELPFIPEKPAEKSEEQPQQKATQNQQQKKKQGKSPEEAIDKVEKEQGWPVAGVPKEMEHIEPQIPTGEVKLQTTEEIIQEALEKVNEKQLKEGTMKKMREQVNLKEDDEKI